MDIPPLKNSGKYLNYYNSKEPLESRVTPPVITLYAITYL